MLPHCGTYIPKVLNAATGEIAPYPQITSVTIPLSVGIKQNQKHEYLSPEWQEAFNLRSAVERKNRQLKLPTFESLNDPDRRPARGYAAHALAVSMIVISHNLRTLDAFLRTGEGIDTKKSRARRSDAIPENELLEKVRKPRDGRRAA